MAYFKSSEELEQATKAKFAPTIKQYAQYLTDFGGGLLIDEPSSPIKLRVVTCPLCKDDRYKSCIIQKRTIEVRSTWDTPTKWELEFKDTPQDRQAWDLIHNPKASALLLDHEAYLGRAFIITSNPEQASEAITFIKEEQINRLDERIKDRQETADKLKLQIEGQRKALEVLKSYIKQKGHIVKVMSDVMGGVYTAVARAEMLDGDLERIKEWHGLDEAERKILLAYNIIEEERDDEYDY